MDSFNFQHFKNLLRTHQVEKALSIVTPENAPARDYNGSGFLYWFCEDGPDDAAAVRQLIQLGVSLELDSDGKRCNPLHIAAKNKPNITRALLDLGTPANILTARNNPPIYFTWGIPSNNQASDTCAKILIDAGAKLGVELLVNDELFSNSLFCSWMKKFADARQKIRYTAIALLGVCGIGGQKTYGNGKDAFRIIARCVWGLRGLFNTQPMRRCNAK